MSDFNCNPTNIPAESTDCARYEPLLTALFDGEATREQMLVARAHLEACARCADAWAAWSQTRNLLRASFVPAPPPGLLLRILLACRLSALPRKTRSFTNSTNSPEVLLLPLKAETDFSHSTDELSLVNPAVHAPMLNAMHAPPVPSHLHDDILRRTVGCTLSAQEFVDTTPLAGSTHRNSLWQRAGTKVRRTGRYLPAMAVPALAAWMMFSTMPFPAMQSGQVATTPLATTPQVRKSLPAATHQSTAPLRSRVAMPQPRPAPAQPAPLQPAAHVARVATAARASLRPVSAAMNATTPQPTHHARGSAGHARLADAGTLARPRAIFSSLRMSAQPRTRTAKAPRPARPFLTQASWSPARRTGARTEAARITPAVFTLKAGSGAGFEPRQTSPARFASAPLTLASAGDVAPASDAPTDDDGSLDEVRFVVDDFRGSLADDDPEDS